MSDHISMEEFGPVSVDYFTQRSVVAVTINEEGAEGDPFWTIEFEGDGKLLNFSPVYPAPENLVGKALNRTIMGGQEGLRLYFGTPDNPTGTMLPLDPMHYAISDPDYTGGKVVFAQRSAINMPPVDTDRLQEGPAEDDEDDGA